MTWYFRPGKVRHLSFGQLTHNLLLTRFLVAAKKLAEGRPDFKLLQVKTCYEVGSDYPSVEVVKEGKKERIKVIPDAWLLFERVSREESVRFPSCLRLTGGQRLEISLRSTLPHGLNLLKEGESTVSFLGEKRLWLHI